MTKFRSCEQEIIDLGPDHYSEEEYEDCLIKLGRIGRWLGGDAATLASLKKIKPHPESILEVGCGGGLFAIRLAKRYPHAKIVGIDLNPMAIQFAKRQQAVTQPHCSHLSFECRRGKKLLEPPKSYDVVMATLVCHHLTDDSLIDFISSASRIAKRKVIINDLHRHPLALFSFRMVSPIFFRNRLVQNDGALSVKRGFKCHELAQLLAKAGIEPSRYSIKWHWAFRWVITIDCGI